MSRFLESEITKPKASSPSLTKFSSRNVKPGLNALRAMRRSSKIGTNEERKHLPGNALPPLTDRITFRGHVLGPSRFSRPTHYFLPLVGNLRTDNVAQLFATDQDRMPRAC